jgi:putative ABC transport system permease protein
MQTNFLKIATRKFISNKTFSFLNVAGLSVGIACFILIGLLVHFELSFDSFHKNKNDIYRIYCIEDSPTHMVKSATTPDPLPKALKNDFPEISHIVRFSGRNVSVTSSNRKFELDLMTTDQDVFEVFTFPFLYGSQKDALKDPYNVVLSYETSIKLFGPNNPVGQTISVMNGTEFKVTGVLEKIPENSSVQFDMLVSSRFRQMIDPEYENRWHSSGTYTFIRTSDKDQLPRIEQGLAGLLEKYQPDWLDGRSRLAIENLRDIHLSKESVNEMVPAVSPSYVFLLAVVAFVIIVIAAFNYTMLMISSYSQRMKEIGVRKIMGASRNKLIMQFLGETMLFSFIAIFIGLILAELFLPEFNQLIDRHISFPSMNIGFYIAILLGMGIAVGFLSGLYPAIYLSSQNTLSLMKKKRDEISKRKFSLPRVLITSQFAISATLIISMLIVAVQISFMKNHDLGFDPKNIVAFPTHYDDIPNPDQKIEAWKSHILENGKSYGTLDASISEHIPGYYFSNAFGVMKASASQEDFEVMIVTSVDEKYGDVYQTKLQRGRFFSSDVETDKSEAVLINETAEKALGFQNAVGQSIRFRHGEGPFTIVGVVKDIHFRSLQHQIEPVIYRNSANWKSQFFAVKIDPDRRKEALEFLSESNEQFGLAGNFEYFYVDEKYGNSYQAEIKIAEIIAVFAGLAILLSCLGLFGQIGVSVVQRFKEIGIRKVLGASGTQIFGLLSTSYIKPILISCFIAWPVSYYMGTQWLQNYPYRITPGFQWLLAGSSIILVIALSVISYHVINAMRNNPINALRDE